MIICYKLFIINFNW